MLVSKFHQPLALTDGKNGSRPPNTIRSKQNREHSSSQPAVQATACVTHARALAAVCLPGSSSRRLARRSRAGSGCISSQTRIRAKDRRISLSLSLSLRFNGHFPGGPGLAGTRMGDFIFRLDLSFKLKF